MSDSTHTMLLENPFNFVDIYKKDELADFSFVLWNRTGGKVTFPVHKFILSARSTIFKTMFECTEGGTASVEIYDTTAEIFDEFLQLFYLKDVDITVENIGDILRLIDKYDAASFWPFIEEFMRTTLSEDVATLYHEAILQFDALADLRQEIEMLMHEVKLANRVEPTPHMQRMIAKQKNIESSYRERVAKKEMSVKEMNSLLDSLLGSDICPCGRRLKSVKALTAHQRNCHINYQQQPNQD